MWDQGSSNRWAIVSQMTLPGPTVRIHSQLQTAVQQPSGAAQPKMGAHRQLETNTQNPSELAGTKLGLQSIRCALH